MTTVTLVSDVIRVQLQLYLVDLITKLFKVLKLVLFISDRESMMDARKLTEYIEMFSNEDQ